MGKRSVPPPPYSSLPPPPPPLPIAGPGGDSPKWQVQCTGCKLIVTVRPGQTEFLCPTATCRLPLMLPSELTMWAQGMDSAKMLQSFLPTHQLPTPEEVNEVAVDVEREENEGIAVVETFLDYHPPKLSIGLPHPDPIVETSSLSAVQPPEPTYDLKIKDYLKRSNTLSCLQIETLVYACQRHLQHLPNGGRAGFFIGDGAGVGKGRTNAGLIWENWHHGRRKALWISVGPDLKFDSRRDLDDVGAECVQVHALNKLPYSKLDSKSVGVKEGVIFLTYSSLIAASDRGRSRLEQLAQWCGSDFDGLIIFDECHKAKNLVPESGGQSTRTGKAVLEIQARLPQARVVYCSATGASEPRNMGYMVRLGLWGGGTCFPDFHKFLGALEKGGVGALELVAMEMKARGMYVCRTLSYKGADFEVVEVVLDSRMMELYNKASEFWVDLREELLASELVSNGNTVAGQVWRFYWANHQRFFRHICMSAKVLEVVRLSKKALMEDKCVVIGLQSTGEARTDEAVTKYGVELDDFISGPRELLLKFVEENYPLPDEPEPVLVEVESAKERLRKRHTAASDDSFIGRAGKIAKLKADSDDETDEESETASEQNSSDDEFQICDTSGSDDDPDDSDAENQICDICNSVEERNKLLECSSCGQLVHPACLVPPLSGALYIDWSCHSCEQKTEGYVQAEHAHVAFADLLKRYEEAVERRSKILDRIRSLDLPNNPLDDIVDQLGGPDEVAEITGRRGLLVRAPNGKGVTYRTRNTKDVSMEMVNMHEKKLFMDGKKLVAIISEAGSAGVSLQADRRAGNQKRRVHLTLELPWSADRAIQQFGRTHRSNQASAPQYKLLFTNLGGERRFASIVAKRLESLGALTQGDRRAGPSLSAYNYDSAYGKKAIRTLYKGIMEQDSFSVLPPGCSSDNPETVLDFIVKGKAALASVGIVRDYRTDYDKPSGYIAEKDMHDVARFLNRLLGIAPDIQNRIFECFTIIFDRLIQNARTEGHFDSGIVDLRASTIELQGTPQIVHVDRVSGASTELFTLTLDRGLRWESVSALLEEKQKNGSASANVGFYESKRAWGGRRHFLLGFEGSASGSWKIFRPNGGEAQREMPQSEFKGKYRKISTLKTARRGWEDEYDISAKKCMHGPNCKNGDFCLVGRRLREVNVLGGLILPVWGTIEKALRQSNHTRLRVVRVETTADKKRIVGLLIPNEAVKSVIHVIDD